jgi:hypothetical protein
MVSEGQTAWLVNVSYKTGQVTLRLITSPDLEAIEWVDRDFQPYYLTTHQQGEPIKKLDLFTGNELRLTKINLRGKPARAANVWELDIDPAMSYAYDKGLRFGLLHHFNGNGWIADAPLNAELSSRFEKIFGAIQRRDPKPTSASSQTENPRSRG